MTIVKVVDGSWESSLLSITRIHLDLIIAIESINKRKHRAGNNSVDKYVYVWQRELVFLTCFLKVVEVYATSDLSNFLLHKNYIDWPGQVLDEFHETYVQKRLNRLLDLSLDLWSKVLGAYYTGALPTFDVESMYDKMRIKRWHLDIRPCKGILEFLQKNKKCLTQLN